MFRRPNFLGKGTSAPNLRQRITRVLMPILMALILIGGFALHSAVRNLLLAQFDHTLLTKVRTLTRFPAPDRVGINLGFTERPLPEFHGGSHAEFFQIWLSDGSVLAQSPSLDTDQELPRRIGAHGEPWFWSLRLPDGRPGRAVGLRLRSTPEPFRGSFAIDLVLAKDSVQLDRLLRGMAWSIAIAGAGLLTLARSGVNAATAAALKPVSRLAREVAAIEATSLHTRIEPDCLPKELQPIAEQINHLMHRLEAAFDRERRFASNAAHELLTPVSELRIAAENALDWPDDPQAVNGLAVEARDVAVQMEHIVRSLLAVAKAEADPTPLQLRSSSVASLVSDVLGASQPRIAERHLGIRCDIAPTLEVRTDPVILRSILSNLVLNAVEYSTAGSELSVAAVSSRESVEIVVGNRTEALLAEGVEHFCEPFWRGDQAHQSREHAGLGLAVSRAFARVLQGDLQIQLQPGNLILARLRIPNLGTWE